MLRLRNLLFQMRNGIKYKPSNKNKTALSKYLLLTNVSISIGFSGLGDYIEQMIEIFSENKTEWNKDRTMKLAITGIPVGIVCHYFYILVDKKLTETTFKVICKKILLSQMICSPICIILFYSTIGYLNEWSNQQIIDNTINKGSKVYMAEWVIWPPALIYSFYYLTTRHRVLYDNVISLGFNVFNSYIVHKELRNK